LVLQENFGKKKIKLISKLKKYTVRVTKHTGGCPPLIMYLIIFRVSSLSKESGQMSFVTHSVYFFSLGTYTGCLKIREFRIQSVVGDYFSGPNMEIKKNTG
jgi:hypothetical protein